MIGDNITFNKSTHKAIGNINGVNNIIHIPHNANMGIEGSPQQAAYIKYPYKYVGDKYTKYSYNKSSNAFIIVT